MRRRRSGSPSACQLRLPTSLLYRNSNSGRPTIPVRTHRLGRRHYYPRLRGCCVSPPPSDSITSANTTRPSTDLSRRSIRSRTHIQRISGRKITPNAWHVTATGRGASTFIIGTLHAPTAYHPPLRYAPRPTLVDIST
jgi:hypothetical protein